MLDKKKGQYINIVKNGLKVQGLPYRNGTTSNVSLSLSLSIESFSIKAWGS
jgi:hypothetical protein